jgi:hypothetical protein
VSRRRHRELPAPAPAFDVRPASGVLQEIIGRTDAMVYALERQALEHHFEQFGWRCREEVDETDDPVGHLPHLIASAREASLSAVSAGRVIADELAKRDGEA